MVPFSRFYSIRVVVLPLRHGRGQIRQTRTIIFWYGNYLLVVKFGTVVVQSLVIVLRANVHDLEVQAPSSGLPDFG